MMDPWIISIGSLPVLVGKDSALNRSGRRYYYNDSSSLQGRENIGNHILKLRQIQQQAPNPQESVYTLLLVGDKKFQLPSF
jgi:hypothetical protein